MANYLADYLDINMHKYNRYHKLSKKDRYNSNLYNYKMAKYRNRMINALFVYSGMTGSTQNNNIFGQHGGTSVQFIGDTYLTNLDTRDRIQRVKQLLKQLQPDGRSEATDTECIQNHSKLIRAINTYLGKSNDTQEQENILMNKLIAQIDALRRNIHSMRAATMRHT